MKTLSWLKLLLVILLVLLLSACSSPIELLRSSATATAGLPLTGASTATSPVYTNSYGGSVSSPTQPALNSAATSAAVNSAPTLEPTETENAQSSNDQSGATATEEPTDTGNNQSNNDQVEATATVEPTETGNNPSNNDQAEATSAPNETQNENPTSAPENGTVNACSLVTAADASETLGVTVTGPSSQTSQGPNQSQCTYTTNNQSIIVTAKTFPGDQQALDDFNSQMQAQRSNQNFATVEDLGDQAFQFANSVVFVNDQYEISIQVTYNPDLTSQINRDKAFALGKTAKDNLP